jgi:hypothetical protein
VRSTDLKKVVEEKLSPPSKCYGHCDEESTLKLLCDKRMMIGCYTCYSGYVSRMVAYGKELDVKTFKAIVSAAIQGIGDVTDEDVRVASRYTWDLGVEGEPEGLVLKEAYWTQNYRRTKSDDPNRAALFLCTKCRSFYHQPATDKNRLCPRCRTLAPD